MKEVTCLNLHTRLTEDLPEIRSLVDQVFEDDTYPRGGAITAYALLSEAFIWGVFQPAAKHADDGVLARCYDFVEALLCSPDRNLRDAALIRVVEYMSARPWRPFTAQLAGPLLSDLIRDDIIDPDHD